MLSTLDDRRAQRRKYGRGRRGIDSLDKLCLSGEVDRRATVYRMLANGLEPKEIAEATGLSLSRVYDYRKEKPANWIDTTPRIGSFPRFPENFRRIPAN